MNDIKWLKSRAVQLIPYIRERLIETQFDEDALVESLIEFARQPTIIHCKECKYGKPTIFGDQTWCCKPNSPLKNSQYPRDNEWFCADGRKKEDVQLLEYADQDTAYYANQEVLRPLT